MKTFAWLKDFTSDIEFPEIENDYESEDDFNVLELEDQHISDIEAQEAANLLAQVDPLNLSELRFLEPVPFLSKISVEPTKIGLGYVNPKTLLLKVQSMSWNQYEEEKLVKSSGRGSEKYIRGSKGKKLFSPGGLFSDLKLKRSENSTGKSKYSDLVSVPITDLLPASLSNSQSLSTEVLSKLYITHPDLSNINFYEPIKYTEKAGESKEILPEKSNVFEYEFDLGSDSDSDSQCDSDQGEEINISEEIDLEHNEIVDSNMPLPEPESVNEDNYEVVLKSLQKTIAILKTPVQEKKKKTMHAFEWGKRSLLKSVDFELTVPKPAKLYPFELDSFQKVAIMHVERGEHVFVAAHTSAGKTVVAEYAIALAMERNTRVVYTSPIKALSNQKFRDFKDTFDSVGLITGDVSINPDGACLVMTTEILRSMLYRGAELIRDIEWVVFDEIHYVNDLNRGVVWEEVIIMLPPHVKMIFLSATTPNTIEFSAWIGRTKQKAVYVIQTEKRPVPLEHFIFANSTLAKILTAEKKFLSDGYKKASNAFLSPKEKKILEQKRLGLNPKYKASDFHKNKYTKGKNPKAVGQFYQNLVKKCILKDNLYPCVIFTFSKKLCDSRAAGLKTFDLTDKAEKSAVERTFNEALKKLRLIDRTLPQIIRIKNLCKIGIAVHHGGLLPLLKEVVEILFSNGIIKILFATETFAIGVNMPAKCVCFSGLRKHDGTSFRHLLPGEYVQMSGRAGRRGLDKTGKVIVLADSKDNLPASVDMRHILTGTPTKLESKFRLSYTLILKLLKYSEMSVAEMIKLSFSEYDKQRKLGNIDLLSLLALAEEKIIRLTKAISREESVVSLLALIYETQLEFGKCFNSTVRKRIRRNTVIIFNKIGTKQKVFFLSVGRFTKFREDGLQVMINDENGKHYLNISFSDIVCVLNIKAKTPRTLKELSKQPLPSLLAARIKEEKRWQKLGFQFGLTFREYDKLVEQISKREIERESLITPYKRFLEVQDLTNLVESTKLKMSDESLQLYPDFKSRLSVLQYLTYVNEEDEVVLLKGRCCIEISTSHELLLTEVIFQNVLDSLTAAESAALLSAFVVKMKNEDGMNINDSLLKAKKSVLQIAERLLKVQSTCEVTLEDDWVNKNLNFSLMEVVYYWASGMPFKEICKLTSVEEGNIVRSITRLGDTLREVRNIAQLLGDSVLFKKMEEASNEIKRDIIFSTSLYIT